MKINVNIETGEVFAKVKDGSEKAKGKWKNTKLSRKLEAAVDGWRAAIEDDTETVEEEG